MMVKELIQNKNIKLTTARVSLLEIFKKANHPLSYENIKNDISMDKATFYRNISKFEEEDIINAFESNDKKRYFELKSKPHAHFVCLYCNNIECIKDLDINLPSYEISNIIINGRCKKCIEEKIKI